MCLLITKWAIFERKSCNYTEPQDKTKWDSVKVDILYVILTEKVGIFCFEWKSLGFEEFTLLQQKCFFFFNEKYNQRNVWI